MPDGTLLKSLATHDDGSGQRIILFCIPHAGGGASAYRHWASALAPHVTVRPLQLPGRESRFGEPVLTALDAALADLCRAVEPDVSRRFALFGHSMGALLAFELAHRLRNEIGLEPEHLFVSACRAPHFPPLGGVFSELPQQAFIDVVSRRYGGIPAAVLADEALMTAVLPAMRADFGILERYRASDRAPLDCPISVFGGWNDTITPQSALLAWRQHTAGAFSLEMLDDGHFYLQSKRLHLIDKILAALRNNQVKTQ
jgi:medium-chain acyl-[acyl-carrier-protein] hydrolase